MLVLLAVEQVASRRVLGSCHQSGFLVVPSRRVLSRRGPSRRGPSRRVLSRWILGRTAKVGAGSQSRSKGVSTSLRVHILFMAVVAGRAVTGRSGLDSLHAQQAHLNMRSSCAAACGTDGRCLGCVENGFFRCGLIARYVRYARYARAWQLKQKWQHEQK